MNKNIIGLTIHLAIIAIWIMAGIITFAVSCTIVWATYKLVMHVTADTTAAVVTMMPYLS